MPDLSSPLPRQLGVYDRPARSSLSPLAASVVVMILLALAAHFGFHWF